MHFFLVIDIDLYSTSGCRGIAAVDYQLAAGGADTAVETNAAFGGFVPCAELVIVEAVVLAVVAGTEVRHHHVGTGQNAQFSAAWV